MWSCADILIDKGVNFNVSFSMHNISLKWCTRFALRCCVCVCVFMMVNWTDIWRLTILAWDTHTIQRLLRQSWITLFFVLHRYIIVAPSRYIHSLSPFSTDIYISFDILKSFLRSKYNYIRWWVIQQGETYKYHMTISFQCVWHCS